VRGTLVNALAVVAGSLLGLWIGDAVPEDYETLAQSAIGIACLALAIKLVVDSRNVLIPVGSLIVGVLVGHLCGLHSLLEQLGEWAQRTVGEAQGSFQEAFVTTSILFCVGPLTILGSIADGVRGDSRMLQFKSMLDGVSSLFVAAALGPGVLLSAVTVLAVQLPIALFARAAKSREPDLASLREVSAAGGLILVVIGLNLLKVTTLPSADYLPSLLFAWFGSKVVR
jgi:uncharacterized membrane protein YqgA involved in biofilm formation